MLKFGLWLTSEWLGYHYSPVFSFYLCYYIIRAKECKDNYHFCNYNNGIKPQTLLNGHKQVHCTSNRSRMIIIFITYVISSGQDPAVYLQLINYIFRYSFVHRGVTYDALLTCLICWFHSDSCHWTLVSSCSKSYQMQLRMPSVSGKAFSWHNNKFSQTLYRTSTEKNVLPSSLVNFIGLSA